jgi:hypothetical protein
MNCYSNKTRAELLGICKEKKIKGYSKKNKELLIQTLNEHIAPETTTPQINKKTKTKRKISKQDVITGEDLKYLYSTHVKYVNDMQQKYKSLGLKVRKPCFPEPISENIVKFILHNKLNDPTSSWACSGDLISEKEGIQECKCFTSDGPITFTPKTDWDVIYFLDARDWLKDNFKLYRVPIKRTSNEWKNITMNRNETFDKQCTQGRRPRMGWKKLQEQISEHCNKVYEGCIDDILNSRL